MLVTSVVSLVTRPEVLNLSILEKLNVWMFSYMAFLRFLAKPAEAREPNCPPRMPNVRLSRADSSISTPIR